MVYYERVLGLFREFVLPHSDFWGVSREFHCFPSFAYWVGFGCGFDCGLFSGFDGVPSLMRVMGSFVCTVSRYQSYPCNA